MNSYTALVKDIAAINRDIQSCIWCKLADQQSNNISTTSRTICEYHFNKKAERRKQYDLERQEERG